MSMLVQNILLISLMCSVVIFIILVMRKMLIKHTSGWWRTLIWMLILIRMCIPLMTQSPIGLLDAKYSGSNQQDTYIYENIVDTIPAASNYDTATNENHNNFIVNNSSSKGITLSLINIVGIIYFMGLAASLLLFIIRVVCQHKYITKLELCQDKEALKILNTLKKQMGVNKDVLILSDNNCTVPMIYGVIKPKIILPKNAINSNSTDLKLILTHELTHITQLDILKLWIMELSCSINWFNPVMYYIKKVINEDIELACDQRVMKNINQLNHYEYSRIIAEYSTKHQFSNLVLSSGINSIRRKEIKVRLDLIKRKGSSQRVANIVIVILTIIFLTACTTINLTNTIPSSFDWRDKGVVTDVQNQGDYATGSIFAAISLMESNIAIYEKEFVDLSEQHFINNSDDYSSSKGVAPAVVLDYLCEYGAVSDNELPYTGEKREPSNIKTSYVLSAWTSYELGDKTPEERIDAIKRHIIEFGPVITPITFYSDLHDYDGGVYEWDKTSQADYGHWLTIVGYKDDAGIASGGYWIAKESWGSDWGEDGYIRIAYNDECGIDDYSIYYAQKPDK